MNKHSHKPQSHHSNRQPKKVTIGPISTISYPVENNKPMKPTSKRHQNRKNPQQKRLPNAGKPPDKTINNPHNKPSNILPNQQSIKPSSKPTGNDPSPSENGISVIQLNGRDNIAFDGQTEVILHPENIV